MSTVILTKSPEINLLSLQFYRALLRALFKQARGPQAVLASLETGLKELGISYKLNPSITEIGKDDTIVANSSLEALRWAIKAKEQGKFTKLVAGPNLVVSPKDANKILCHTAIDLVLVPCIWVKDFYIAEAPELRDKLYVWPAGVSVPEISNNEKKDIILYLKNQPADLIEKIETTLTLQQQPYKKFVYGQFKQSDYFTALNSAKALIYVSNSESQGLAMFEAWVRDVPTLVWSRGYFEYGEYSWKDERISAPYLEDSVGLRFTGPEDFARVYESFILGISDFTPRQYILENFTNKVCAEKFLKIINHEKAN